MPNITVCPKELFSPSPITAASAADFEVSFVAPLLEFIEGCESNGVSIRFSAELFELVIARAPWVESSDPVVSTYLNAWYAAIAEALSRYATINTSGQFVSEQCAVVADIDINNHFKELLHQLSQAAAKTITAVNHLGIHVKETCPKNSECICNIFVNDVRGLKVIKTPWYLAYPHELPDGGDYSFQPPKGWEHLNSAVKGGTKGRGYIDEFGHSWEWDMLHKNHWDVQRGGTGNYTNVTPEGKILPKK